MTSKNILYVFDELIDINKYLKNHKESNIFLCPLTIDQECITSTIEKLRSENNCELITINFQQYFLEKAFSIRDEYIKFIADFAEKPVTKSKRKNLKEYFKYPLKNFSIWWFSLIAEKNTLKSNSYHKLVKFLTILDLQKKYSCDEIWLSINDADLTHLILNYNNNCQDLRNHKKKSEIIYLFSILKETLIYFLFFMLRIITVKKAMRGLSNRKNKLKNSKYLLVTYFPLLDKEELKHKKFINKYYKPLQTALEKKCEDRITWLALIVGIDGFDLKQSVALGKQINEWGYSLFFTEEWITFKDFFVIISQYSYTLVKFLFKLPYISKEFKYPDSEGDINVWQLFKRDWYRSFCGLICVEGLIYYRLFSNIFRDLKEKTIITYIAEMHAWEKALNIAASQEQKGLKTIGIQHTVVSLLLLMYFNYKAELEDGDNIQKMPKPNYLACVGKIPVKLFRESGWNENKLFTLGAIRHQYLKQFINNKINWKNRENKVVVALSILLEESKETLLYVYQAFKNQTKYRVVLKGHPFLPVQLIANSLNIKLDGNTFHIVETPLSELLPVAKAVIVNGSASALEGIACQCPVIIPRLSNIIDINPLAKIRELPTYVSSPEELKKVVDEIIDRKESPILYENCKNFIEEYFEFHDSNEEFLNILEEIGSKELV